MIKNYQLSAEATPKEIYDEAVRIARFEPENAQEYFDALVTHTIIMSIKDKMTRLEAQKIVHTNIGYWAGYFEPGTIELVYSVYGSEHPVFGKETPTDQMEVLRKGIEMGAKIRREEIDKGLSDE